MFDHHDRTFLCECEYPGHQLEIYKDDLGSLINVNVNLTPGSFWFRLKVALAYVFNRNRYGNYAEVLLNTSDTARLITLLGDFTSQAGAECAKDSRLVHYAEHPTGDRVCTARGWSADVVKGFEAKGYKVTRVRFRVPTWGAGGTVTGLSGCVFCSQR
jgi:hypothetical protein